MPVNWRGVFPALTTKFNDDFSVDYDANRAYYRKQIAAGIHGIILAGSLGEASTLTHAEKLQLLSLGLEEAAGKIPVMLTIAEGSTASACELARQAAYHGAKGLMVLPPMQYVSTPEETMDYLRAVADAAGIPIMVYNNPVSYKIDTTPEMFVQLADHPGIVAIKESSDDVRRITEIRNLTGDRYKIFTGVDNLGLESLLMGADGWVAGLVCAFPEETVAIYNLAVSGRHAEALEIYRWFFPLLKLDVSPQLVQNIKLAEVFTGMGNDVVRPPRKPLSGAERQRVETVIKTALAKRPDLGKYR
jgi:dihydrodipicolinate synthase/N-acetylneuraminate lyase